MKSILQVYLPGVVTTYIISEGLGDEKLFVMPNYSFALAKSIYTTPSTPVCSPDASNFTTILPC